MAGREPIGNAHVLNVKRNSLGNHLRVPIPKGYAISIATRTNSTMSGIRGAGRTVDALLSSAGRRLERVIDQFAEQRLGLGPNVAAIRFTAALHELHVQERQSLADSGTLSASMTASSPCSNENTTLGDVDGSSVVIAERLIWACNGTCSQCFSPYVPKLLADSVPETILKAVAQLMSSIRGSAPTSNLALAVMYIRLIMESNVFAVSLMQKLRIAESLRDSLDSLLVKYWNHDPLPDAVFTLQETCELVEVHQATIPMDVSNGHRFASDIGLASSFGSSDTDELTNSMLYLTSPNQYWGTRQIALAKLISHTHHIHSSRNDVTFWSRSSVRQHLDALNGFMELSNTPISAIRLATIAYQLIVDTHVVSRTLTGHSQLVACVVFSPDGTQIASGSWDGTVRKWNISNWMMQDIGDTFTGSVNSIAFSSDGRQILSGLSDTSIVLWDAETGDEIAVFSNAHTDWVKSLVFSPDDSQIASGSSDGTIRIWNVRTRRSSVKLDVCTGEVNSVAFSPDGMLLACGADDKHVHVWDVQSNNHVAILRGHQDRVLSVTFSPNGKILASGSSDYSVRLWDVECCSQTSILDGHTDWVTSVAFSPDATHMVSASDDTTVRLWDVRTGQSIAVLRGHNHWVRCIAFSPDGEHIASGSHDKTVRVWDISALMMGY